MPYVMPLLLGFFDRAAAERGKVELRHTLDMELAHRLVTAAAERWEGGVAYIGRDRFALCDGYLKCCDRPHRAGADFIIRFARQTGCEIYHYAVPFVYDVDSFAAYFEQSEQMRQERLRRSRAERGLS